MIEVEKNVDIKLKVLIQACKETDNIKKVSVTGFILLSNKVQEIALKLGMRPRNEAKNELLFNYMNVVNTIFENNLKIKIFNDEMYNSIKKIELLFLRNRGDIPQAYTRELLKVYYKLRELEIPNLYKNAQSQGDFEDSNLHMLNYLSPNAKKNKSKNMSKFRPLILQKIKEQERTLQGNLNSKLDQTNLERILFLKKIKEGLGGEKKNKISLQGILKNSLDYQQSPNVFIKYFIIGFGLLCALVGIVILAEVSLYPIIINIVMNTLFMLFGFVIILIFLYRMFSSR